MSTAADLVVRDSRPEELGAVRDLTLRAYAEYATIMAPAAWAGLAGAVRAALDNVGAEDRVVAERGGALLGSVMLFPPATDAYGAAAGSVTWPVLRLLAVAPEARGQGIGQALVDECVRRARGMGAAELGLHSSESLRAAIRMYQRMGFERAPEHDFQPPGAELVMAFRLPLGAG